jgi:general secretion pathway protein G
VRRRGGFTLIELLIVVLVIGVLATLLLPNYRKAVYKAQAADVVARVEAINVSLKNYESDDQVLPAATGPVGSPPDFLAPYARASLFAGPGGLTFQLISPGDGSSPTLLIRASSDPGEPQILLAVAGMLGPLVTVMGGGSSIAVTLSG